MPKYVLTDDLITGNELIDNEHRCLLDAANHLMEACSAGEGRSEVIKVLEFLQAYVNIHFNNEEQLMAQHEYPEFENHRDFHAKYAEKLAQIVNATEETDINLSNLVELNKHLQFLVVHIRTADKNMAKFLNSAEVQRFF